MPIHRFLQFTTIFCCWALFFASCNNESAQSPPIEKISVTDLQWLAQPPITTVNLRGLFVVNDEIIWASGSEGVFLRTIDGGKNWSTTTIEGADSLDFRDIHAFNQDTAMVLSSGHPAHIFKTIDGGKSWRQTYFNDQEGIFFDGFDFENEKEGMAFSDPIGGKLVVIKTIDGGDQWEAIEKSHLPSTLEGEAGYAASGTGIVYRDNEVWIATGGGERARVFHSMGRMVDWQVFDTPIVSAEGKGIFSMTMFDTKNGVIVGGSYIDSTNNIRNCAITENGGKTWQLVTENQPNGYRSCVAHHPIQRLLIAVGRTGTDVSINGGKSWQVIGNEGYYACGIAEKTAWAVGKGGKMAKMVVKNK